MNPRFRGIGEAETSTKGFVVLPVWLPNAAALSGDQKHAKVLLIWCEFQVIDSLGANYLLGRDALHPYGVNINESEGHLLFPQCKPPVKIPILDGPSKFASKLNDNQVYCSHDFTIRPREQRWIPVYFERPSHSNDLLLSAKRSPEKAEGTYPICPYAVMDKNTDHILFFNPGKRPSRYKKGDVVGQFESVAPNTPYSHFNLSGMSNTSVSPNTPLETSFSVSSIAPELVGNLSRKFTGSSSAPANPTIDIIPVPPPLNSVASTSSHTTPFDVSTLSNSFSNRPDLEWYPGVSPDSTLSFSDLPTNSSSKSNDPVIPSGDHPNHPHSGHHTEPFGQPPGPTIPSDVLVTIDKIDPFGLENEFRKEGPLEPRDRNDDIGWRDSDLPWDINPMLNRSQRRAILKMLRKHIKVFAGPEGRLGRVDAKFDMDIQGDLKGIKSQQPYRTSPDKQKHIKDAIDTMTRLDVIQPSNSSVASPVIVVIQHGKPRFCVDLREVNSKITADRYALPKQDMIFAALIGAIFFTILDANRGYHQFGLTLRSRKFTAFTTDFGLFEFKRVPFGLKTAPAHFQRAIDIILGSMRWDFALAYIDDIIVYSKTLEEHIEHIAAVLEALEKAGMTLAEGKCHFGYQDIKLLGHRISRLGLSTLEEKVQAIMAIPYPETVKQAMVILGMFNYYRSFIDSFALVAAPLYDGLKGSLKDTSLSNLSPKAKAKIRSRWRFPDTPDCRQAFQRLKDALANAPTLIHPDFTKEFILYCDACRKRIAAILQQVSPLDNKEHPICYISRRLNSSEYHYASTELECLAIVWALDKLSHYVDGSQLKLVTDHSALKWIWSVKPGVNARLFRWSLILNPLRDRVTIVHRPGKMHSNVDPLSRNPSYVTLIKMSDEWEDKIAAEYQEDSYYRRIIKELLRIQEEGEAAKQRIIRRNNKKFEKAANKAQEVDETIEKAKTMDKVVGMDENEDKDEKAMDKAALDNIMDSKAVDEATQEELTTSDSESRELPETSAPPTSINPRNNIATSIVPPQYNDVTMSTPGQPVADTPMHREPNQKFGDLRTAISPAPTQKATSSSSGQLPSQSLEQSSVDSTAKVDSSSPKEVEVDGKEKNVFRKEAEAYANELDEDDEIVDGLDLPDDMPEEIALSEALDEAREEIDRDGIVDHVLDDDRVVEDDSAKEGGPVHKKLEEFVDDQKKQQEKTITDGTFTLIGRTLFFTERRKGELRLCVPESMVLDVLRQNHDDIEHPGIRKTYLSIASRYYIRRLSHRVRQHVNNCVVCQTSKPSNERMLGKLYPIETPEPNHTLSLDFITGLPLSEHKFNALLTVTDKLTKAIRLIPCTTETSAEDTARLFLDYCYPIFGLPFKLISDRDARFTSRFWQTLMNLLGIKLGLTAAYHPAADGQSEKTNDIVETALRCFIAGDTTKYSCWTRYLPIIEHEYNSMVHTSTGFSPNELRFAIVPRSIPDAYMPTQLSSSESAEELAEDLRNRREKARDSIAAAQRKQKRYADKHRSGKTFEVGDLVVLKYKRFGPGYKPPKEHQSKIGPTGTPLRILERISPNSYRLDLPTGSQIHDVVSVVHLRKYNGKDTENVRSLPVIAGENVEPEWEVESIEGERRYKEGIQYLVKWKGYVERTWEPAEYLENAPKIVADWRSSRPDGDELKAEMRESGALRRSQRKRK